MHAAPTLVPLDGEPVEAELIAIDVAGTLIFRSAADNGLSTSLTVPIDRLVRWGNPVPPRPQIIVVLADGGRLLTAAVWAGGAPVRLENDSLIVLTDVWDEVRLPRRVVHGIIFAQRNHPRDRERLEDAVREFEIPQTDATGYDAVLLTNKDRVTGQLKVLTGGSLEFATSAGVVKLPLSRVEAIVLGSSVQPPPGTTRPPNVLVGTTDGTLLKAARVVADDNTLSVELAGGLQLARGNVRDLVFLQSLDGPFAYLTDLEPLDYRHVPYLSIEWPYQRDRNVLGEPLAVGGQRYLKGLGMHSASRITYRLDGQYRRFDAMVAIDDSAGKRGSVTFGVYVSQGGQWNAAFTSGIVRGGDPPQAVSVNVSGSEALTLTVDFADRGDELDHADWLDARLVR